MKSIHSARLPLAVLTTLLAFAIPTQAQLGPPPSQLFEPNALRVFVCGSASPLGNVPDRAQTCLAVIAGERMFLVDVGAGAARNIGRARLPMQNLEGVIITHYHSDHIADLPGVNLNSWVAGRSEPLEVLGPEGIEQVVAGFNQAYALDRSYRTAHHGEELLPAAVGPMSARTIDIGTIYDQDGLTITAFEVDHPPIEPAFGYRFDYLGRSVVISGDSNATESLAKAAKGVDLLFHDAMLLPMLKQLETMLASNERMQKIVKDVQDYHAPTTDVVELATAAEVRQVAFYHLVPAPANAMILNQFTAGLGDDVVVVADGMLFELPQGSEAIEHRQLFD